MSGYRVHALFANRLPEWRSNVADGTARCIATRALSQQLDGIPVPALAGTLEAWFESLDVARAWQTRVNRDYAPSASLIGTEFQLFHDGGTGSDIKGKFLFRRKQGMSVAEFQSYWRDRHGPIVLRTPEIRRYVQSHVIEDDTFDGITEIHWLDYAAASRSMRSREMTVEQAGDAANFAAPGSVQLVLLSYEELN